MTGTHTRPRVLARGEGTQSRGPIPAGDLADRVTAKQVLAFPPLLSTLMILRFPS